MSTATATKTKPVTFISFASDYCVIMEPVRRPDRSGTVEIDGMAVAASGVNLRGRRAQFENRKFTTDDPELIEYLREHEHFNLPRGFREDFDSARPSFEEQINAITNFAVEADVESLTALIQDEESHGDGGREGVLTPARQALASLEAQRDRVREIEEEEQADREQAEADAAAERADVARDEQTADASSEGDGPEEPSAEADVNDDLTDADGADASDSG